MEDNTQEGLKEKRLSITVFLDKSLVDWIEARAGANKRARCREIEVLLEDAKRRAESEVAV